MQNVRLVKSRTLLKAATSGFGLLVLSTGLSACSFIGEQIPNLWTGAPSTENASQQDASQQGKEISSLQADAAASPGSENVSASASRVLEHLPSSDQDSASSSRARASLGELLEAGTDGSTQSAGSISGLEVTWKIPPTSVEGFVLYYGTDISRLDHERRVSSDELETASDPTNGAVYRYIIPDVPPKGPLFIAISSYTGIDEGPRSEPVAVALVAPASPTP